MAMNTPYLGSNLVSSVSSTNAGYGALNTPYIATGLTELTSAVSVNGIEGVASSLAVGALAPSFASSYNASTAVLSAQSARFLSRNTTASATSVIQQDGEFLVAFVSATSARLCFRSGVTTYTWIATTGAVL